jgi:hypothetical protein
MKMTGWAWDHARAVADRNENRFETRGELEQYLLTAHWTPCEVGQMMAYLDRKNRKEAKT